ncbi:hypothetical protein K431DRAFT_287656 [Polychaeton citri CBS 116435]|uniref:very-long-chain enoyl-CoA reductase n=1 Tax=Polychaeton citri CBS 116435 TaxID=1314669 RepID=A0A9P4Q5G5_9PEZI|nr:hypothetical protein K431DRAFT_287656 [Polychaeton citri CBS 116435]
MASKPVTISITPRGRKIPNLPKETSVYIQGSTNDLYHRVAAEASFSIHRLRITKASDGSLVPNDKKTTISSIGLGNGDAIQVKDLGAQIGWRTCYIIEYLGPMLIHPLFYLLRPYLYSNAGGPPSHLQTLACITITLHYIKRELETIFIHRFSSATMPFRNVFKNSFHYWVLGGAFMAYFLYSPTSSTAGDSNSLIAYTAVALYALSELANLNAHIVLMNLRSPGGTERGVPRGFGFSWVTCPNYFFEALAWVGIWLLTWNWATGVFAVIGIGQMAIWAKKRENRYRKESGGKYQKKRFCMLPGIW